jgi:hypothetical protein
MLNNEPKRVTVFSKLDFFIPSHTVCRVPPKKYICDRSIEPEPIGFIAVPRHIDRVAVQQYFALNLSRLGDGGNRSPEPAEGNAGGPRCFRKQVAKKAAGEPWNGRKGFIVLPISTKYVLQLGPVTMTADRSQASL